MSLFSKKETIKLDIQGMHCEKCVARVTEALEGVEGVTGVEVSLEQNTATVEGRGLAADELVNAVVAIDFGASVAE